MRDHPSLLKTYSWCFSVGPPEQTKVIRLVRAECHPVCSVIYQSGEVWQPQVYIFASMCSDIKTKQGRKQKSKIFVIPAWTWVQQQVNPHSHHHLTIQEQTKTLKEAPIVKKTTTEQCGRETISTDLLSIRSSHSAFAGPPWFVCGSRFTV